MSYQIVTDSSCNLTEVLIDELELEILPLTFMVDGVQHQSYLKGETTDLKQFYTMMREGKVITTSLPNLSNSEKPLTDILKSGKDILYLGFSSGLSGTYNSIETLICAHVFPSAPSNALTPLRHPWEKAFSCTMLQK